MVDPNPARGMPLQLQRYWLAGKGAAKIRWGMPHDFYRCVRHLRKYFPKDPQGLCNILHRKALGVAPGQEGPHKHSLTASASLYRTDEMSDVFTAAAQELLDQQPKLGQYLWAGPLAPIGRPTGEPRRTRIFEPGALTHRVLPLPLDWRPAQGDGHGGAMTVGRILGITYGPDHQGVDFAWGWGDYLDEDIVPEAKRARYLAEMGVAGPSVDPGGRVAVAFNPETGFEHLSQFTIGGATLVSIPAFAIPLRQVQFENMEDGDWPDSDPDMVMNMLEGADEGDCGCGAAIGSEADRTLQATAPQDIQFTVNTRGWHGLPLAPREAVFDNDDAVKRIAAWAGVNSGGANVERLRQAFMYYDPSLPATDPTSYRLPVGDVINGKLTLIYHAIYAAAALLSGAHGGLPGVSDQDQTQLRNVISDIYPVMAKEFNDSSIRAPWDRSAQEGVQLAMDEFAAAEQPYGDIKYADPGYRDNTKRYPIDTPDHIRAAWAYINMPKNAGFYNAEQLADIKKRIKAAADKAGVEISDQAAGMKTTGQDTYSASGFPIYPPKEWFEDPGLARKTKLTVTDEGHVFGHLAAWGECHRDVTQRECVLAPKSQQQYAPFHLGTVVTDDGDTVAVGKIVMDTRHANINLGYTAAALHYDNTGDEIAVIRCGEDQFGIWFSGAVVPEATAQRVAKLRRSPLSGDWRRERGNLELTAALAVNAPAFPVYSMEGEQQMALVAAGTVWLDEEPQPEPVVPPTGIIAAMATAVDDVLSMDERAQWLHDILEDEQIYEQRERSAKLAQIFAADTATMAPPNPQAVPTPAQVDTTQQQSGDQNQALLDDPKIDESEMDAWTMAAMADARFSQVIQPGQEIPGIDSLNSGSDATQATTPPVATTGTTATQG